MSYHGNTGETDSMWEVLDASMAAVNLPYTVFLGLILLYWLAVIVGGLDLDLFNVEVDADVDVDTDMETAGPGLSDVGLVVLQFFHVGTMPLMLLLSVLALSMWGISVLTNYYLHNQSLLVALLFFVPNVIVSLFTTKVVTLPFRALFRSLHDERQAPPEVLGKICVIKTSRVDAMSGQAEIAGHGAPLLLNVRTTGGEVLCKGEEALVVQCDEYSNTYIVARL
jgi:hypothetical protein